MALDKKYYIHTQRNGRLGDSKPEDIDAIFQDIAASDRVVIHFHGGLVSKTSALGMAERLRPEYEEFARPLFFIWESGLTETWGNNADELARELVKIAGEEIFKKLTSTVTKWTVGKLNAEAGTKGPASDNLPLDDLHAIEMHKATTGQEPYDDLEPPEPDVVTDVDETDEGALIAELSGDPDFIAQVESILVGLDTEDSDELKAALPHVEPVPTEMSPDVLQEMAAAGPEPGEKGLISAAYLARRAANVLFRVVRRYRAGRDHGIYATVVEELLRELYLASLGAATWHIMKNETADTFQPSTGDPRAGELFLRKLQDLGDDRPSRIVLVGHSTGAVFINNLLDATRKAREDGRLAADFAYDGVVFLAPACTFTDFARVLPKEDEAPLFHQFRMFTMNDERERANRLASIAYPRSLLYFVSGVVEREPDGAGAFDMPLVGMDRYYARTVPPPDVYGSLAPEIKAVRDFVLNDNRAVWSPTETGSRPGFMADAISHTGFDDTGLGKDGSPVPRAVIDSVRHILEKGWE